MALVLADRVLETTPVVGLNDANLSGAQTNYQPFSVIGGGNTTYYTIVDNTNNAWEVGIGTYVLAGNYISRDTVLSSSNGGAKVFFSSGDKDIFLDLPSEEVLLSAGDVYGPASAVANNFAAFNMTTGKLIKDSGYNASSFATAAQGAKADTAVQPGDLGTAAYLDAGVANGVATLDAGGKVPVSQIPQMGDLNYQGTWDAATNTPTLTSSAGTKGFYYVVSVAGSTNLNGITDWKVGDWAVYNGSVWQKIDNTDLVTSVNGYTGTVVLNYTDVGAFPATSTTGSGNVVLATGATQASPTISDYENFTPTTAPTYTEGRVWYDSTEKALAFYNDSSALAVHVGQDLIFKVINNTGSTIPNGSPVYVTSTSSGQTYPNIALAKADVAATSAVIGLTNGAIANGAIGYVTSQGTIDNVNTSTFTVGQVLYLSPYSAGQLMNTIPPTGITVQVGVVTFVNSSTGHIYVKQTTPLTVPASIITGTLGVDHGGTGATTLTGYVKGSGTSAFTASTTIPTTDLSGTVTNAQLANSSITINGSAISLGGTVSVGTVTSVTGSAPIASSGGTTPAISISQATTSTDGYLSSTDWNTFNSKGSGSVTSVGGTGSVNGITLTGTVTTSGNLTLGGTLSGIGNSQLTNSSVTFNGVTVALGASGTITAATPNALSAGTGLSFASGTTFDGSAARTLNLADTAVSAGSYTYSSITVDAQGRITAASSGTAPVTSVSVASANGFAGTSSGGSTPALTLTTSITGVLKGNGTAISAATAGTDYVAPATATTFTAKQSFTGSTSVLAAVFTNTAEVVTVSATAATGTINYDVTTQSVLYYTTNASANWTVNVRGSSTATLNSVMATGESLTLAFLVTQGATAYYNNAFTIDGNAITPKWQGGTAPTAGNASSVDIYTYTIVKTGSATFTVFASQTQFK
jgi:hypothetical protein